MTTLSEMYDDVEEEVRAAVRLDADLRLRGMPWATRALMLRLSPRLWRYLRKRPDSLRKRLSDRATSDERESRFVEIVTASHFIEELAADLRRRFGLTGNQAEALERLHAEREREDATFAAFMGLRALRNLAVAAVALLAAQLPKESFEVLGWDSAYGWYRLGLLLFLLTVLLYVALPRLLISTVGRSVQSLQVLRDASRVRHVTGLVLMVCATAGRFPQGQAPPPRS